LKKMLVIAVIGALGWYALAKHQASAPHLPLAESASPADGWNKDKEDGSEAFSCDGRTRCPQMKSCAEATYFIRNCPGTEMDGDGDGLPCESQWCGGG
jgi:hypothetical protein